MTGMNCNAWEVWTAKVKYEDSSAVKSRPVLVIKDTKMYTICLKMTSKAPRPGEYLLNDWRASGLTKPTTVRVGKILRLSPRDLKRKIGDLSPFDIANVQSCILARESSSKVDVASKSI